WCAAHNLTLTGHTIEELARYVTQGNYVRTLRHLQIPTTDNEDFRYTWPREIGPWKPKQVSSIAHLYGQPRAGAEAMGGAGWCFTLDMARYGFNMLGAYGINFFVPHLFHYAQDMPANMDDWPNSWFFQNPYWKYFKTFADHGRRLSYMLTGGEPVVDVCILYPETNLWSGYGPGNIQETIAALVARQVDADILDPDSLLRAEIADGALRACTAAYPILVVPGVQCLRRAEADKILAFAQAGGTVLLQDRWPTDSMEEGRDDPHMAEFREKMEAIGTQTSPFDATLDLIAQREDRDLIVTEGNPAALRYRHLQQEGKDIYWLVNGGRAKQEWLLDVRAAGAPELWQPEDGSIRPAADAVRRDQRTACHVDLDGWQGCFLVIEADKETPPGGCLLEETNLRDARAVVDDGSIEVSGLLPPEAAAAHATLRVLDIALTETQVRLEEDAHSTLPVTQLDGPWTSLPDGGQLDQVWKASLDSSVLELPVMRVRWEQEGQLQDGDWRSPLYDDKHWREVKVLDTRHPEDGALRYRSRWNARFISFHEYKSFDLDTFYSPKIGGKGLRCANTYILGPEAETGWLAVACESPFTVSVNGAEIGRGSGGGSPEVIELPAMRPGETELVITAEDSIALLAEGEWSNAYGASTSITTDRTWRVSLDGQDWREAWEYVGPPEASYGEPTHPKVLKTPGTLWYRCELPSGAVGVLPPEIEGDWKAWMDGMPLVFAEGEAPVPLSPLPHALALRVHLEDGQHGLVKPIRARCAPVETALGNWSAIGIEWYSGRVVYCTRFTLPGGQLPSNIRMELDLGRVCFNAEVWVNGILSGVRVWPSYRLDVTEQLRPGENELVVVVASLIANRMTWDIYDEVRANLQSRKWHETSTLRDGWCLESGLIGPVHLVPLRKVVLTKKVD
ncbi:MAG: hypothetical protein HYV26_23560, partial [Candidatus Hydrogenedentes bacterium]|nr:hypothetical protein [Candidatus Hydrogenedentota bacterium]